MRPVRSRASARSIREDHKRKAVSLILGSGVRSQTHVQPCYIVLALRNTSPSMDNITRHEQPRSNGPSAKLPDDEFHEELAEIQGGPLTEDDLVSLMHLVTTDPSRESLATDCVVKSSQGHWLNIWHGFLQISGRETFDGCDQDVASNPEDAPSPASSCLEDGKCPPSLSSLRSLDLETVSPRVHASVLVDGSVLTIGVGRCRRRVD